MKILVTGAEGFVGTHLCKALRDRGHGVIESDIDRVDLSKPGQAARLIWLSDPDHVVHLAARYGRLLCRDEPHRAVADNAAATAEIAAVCADRNIPLLYTSSSEVYGDHGEDVVTEDSELKMPTTIYGLSKRWGEEVIRLYTDRACIVRMNMLYGPGQQAGYGRCALATFIANALDGEPFDVHADASRSWLYIGDACEALCQLVEGGHVGVFNLGNETERTAMTDLAEMVCEETGSDLYTVSPAPVGQIRHKVYSTGRLREAIDWAPRVSLREGVRRTVAFEQRKRRTGGRGQEVQERPHGTDGERWGSPAGRGVPG